MPPFCPSKAPLFSLLGLILFALSSAAQTVRYEAEQAARSSLSVASAQPGFSGTGYVTGFTNDTGSLTFSVYAPTAGIYTLSIGYGTPHGQKYAALRVNEQSTAQIHLHAISGFGAVAAGDALFQAGANTVTVEKGWGWYWIDYLDVTPAAPRPPHQAKGELVNPNANARARSLMAFLVDHFGSHTIAGQQDSVSGHLVEVDYIYRQTGRRPALLGLDFMDYSPSRVERGATSTETAKAIDWWENYGGMVALTWHWNAPKDLIDQAPDKLWWRGFYTYATTFDVGYAMDNPESEDYALLLRDIDAIAEQLQILQQAGVPVLWRPLHEAEGGWFWWGARGPEPCLELWRVMFERMTHHHQINNLIWVWNSVSPDWYPGDDYVDIVSYDAYTSAYDYSPANAQYDRLMVLSDNRKVIALAENGSIPDPDLAESLGAFWSWFCVWNGYFIRDWNSVAHLQKVYHHPRVLTLEDLPDLRTYRTASEQTRPFRLAIGLSAGQQVRLSWPAEAGGWNLQKSPVPRGNYSDSPAEVTVEGDENVVYDSIGQAKQFYRLIKSP